MSGEVEAGRAIRESFAIYADDAGALITFAAAAFLPVSFVSALLSGSGAVAAALISSLLLGPVTLLYHGAVAPTVVASRKRGPKPHPGDVLDFVQPVAGALALAGLLWILGVMLGFLALIVPGLILLTWWSLVGPAIALERREPITAFARSRELVRGHAWQVFGALAGLVLLLAVARLLLLALGAAIAGTAGAFIGDWLGVVLAAPPVAILVSILFLDLGGSAEPPEEEEEEPEAERREEGGEEPEAERREEGGEDPEAEREEGGQGREPPEETAERNSESGRA